MTAEGADIRDQALDAFIEAVRSGRDYRTPQAPDAGPDGRRLGRSVRFHARLFRIYLRARRESLDGRFDSRHYTRASFDILKVVERAGGRVCATGLGHVAAVNGPVVVVGNHMSTLETLLLPGLLVPIRDTAFVVKTSLTRYPIFGPTMCAVPRITVDRRNARADLHEVMVQGQALLDRGVSVVVFPQATRSVVFDPARFNTLGIKLAARAGVPAIPLALKTDFHAKGRLIKDFGPVDPGKALHFAFGPALHVAGNGRAEHGAVVAHIIGHLQAWGGTIAG